MENFLSNLNNFGDKKNVMNKTMKKNDIKIGKTQVEKFLVNFNNEYGKKNPALKLPGKLTNGHITKPEIITTGNILKDKQSDGSSVFSNENLLKIINLTKKKPTNLKTNRALLQNDDNKSLFNDINKKYNELKNNRMINECDDMNIPEREIENIFNNKFMERDLNGSTNLLFIDSGIEDPEKSLITKIITEQEKIVQTCSNSDLLNYKDTPVSYVKRKFIKRFNELTLANKKGTPMTPEEVQYIEEIKSCAAFQDVEIPDQPQGSSTPIKTMIFPETSYRTPENQKFVYKAPETETYQTCLYMVPDNYESTLRKKIPQENMVEVVVPESVTNRPGLFEITKNETSKDFVFSPKIDKKKMKFDNLDDGERIVLSKWKNQIKHVYEIGARKNKNIELGENTVINLKKNLLFDDCDKLLARPKKSCRRRKSTETDVKLQVPVSPFSNVSLNDIDNSISRADIRRKLNYSNHDASLEKENIEPLLIDSPKFGEYSQEIHKSKSPKYTFKGFAKPKYSPNEFELRRKYAPHTLNEERKIPTNDYASKKKYTPQSLAPIRETSDNKIYSPIEYALRKKYIPHTLTSEDTLSIENETKMDFSNISHKFD